MSKTKKTYVARCTHCYDGRVWDGPKGAYGRCKHCNGTGIKRLPIPNRSKLKGVAMAVVYVPLDPPEENMFGNTYDHPSISLIGLPAYDGEKHPSSVLSLEYQRNGAPCQDERRYFTASEPRLDFGVVRSSAYGRKVGDYPRIENSSQATRVARLLARLEKARDKVPSGRCELSHDADALVSLGVLVEWRYLKRYSSPLTLQQVGELVGAGSLLCGRSQALGTELHLERTAEERERKDRECRALVKVEPQAAALALTG